MADSNPSRRSVLKSISTGTAILGTTGLVAGKPNMKKGRGSGKRKKRVPKKYRDITVVDYDVKSKSEAKNDLRAVSEDKKFNELVDKVDDDTELEIDFEADYFASIELITTKRK
ncbi:hypothetical protein [Halorhabdus rudnickae]|uniref:hypothetical protein n=1 Tax=Halorhabdus rudnickae TaxID=1775544 RepID=UPI00108462C9|nr:hypothetical protein [Halorhabdus rudnickae]